MHTKLAAAVASILLTSASLASAQDGEIDQSPPAETDFIVEKPIEVKVPVTRLVWECRAFVERYGFRGRRSRVVYRWVQVEVQEQVSEVRIETQAFTAVARMNGAANKSELVNLEAPYSTEAVATAIDSLVDNRFRSPSYSMVPRNRGAFPVDFNSTMPASDGVWYQFRIERNGPRSLEAFVFALNDLDPTVAGSTTYAEDRLKELVAELSRD